MRRSGDRGQATVEFALVLPLLVICIAGLVWVGQVVTTQVRLEHAAREGARGCGGRDPGDAAALAKNAVARSFPESDGVTVIVGVRFVEVRVWRRVDGVPFLGVGSRELAAEAHMRREDLIDGQPG